MPADHPKFILHPIGAMGEKYFMGELQEVPERLSSSTEFGRITRLIIERLRNNFGAEATKLFHDGGEPYNPFSNKSTVESRTAFEKQIAATIAGEIGELFDDNGSVLPGKEQDYQRVLQLSPQLINVFTSKEYFVRLVQEDHIVDLVRMGVRKSLRPETIISLRVGFGGSDSIYTAERLPVYAAPALEAATAIDRVFAEYLETRRKIALSTVIKRAYAQWEQNQGSRKIETEERITVKRQIAEDPNVLNWLTADEQAGLKAETEIYDPKTVRVECIFALHSAEAANGTNDFAEKQRRPELLYIPDIILRTRANEQAVRNFAAALYPDLVKANRVVILEDKSWDKFTPYEKNLLAYIEAVLEKSVETSVVKTLKTLRETGRKHGGEDKSLTYAGLHPWFFGDDLAVPGFSGLRVIRFGELGEFLDTSDKETSDKQPDFRVSYGGDPERYFDRIRTYLQENVTAQGFAEFISQKLKKVRRNSAAFRELTEVLARVVSWQSTNQDYRLRPSIALITVTRQAPYYPIVGIDRWIDKGTINLSPEAVADRLVELKKALSLLEADNSGNQKVITERAYIRAVIADYRMLETVLERRGKRQG